MKKSDACNYYPTSDSMKTIAATAGCILFLGPVNPPMPLATFDNSNQVKLEEVYFIPSSAEGTAVSSNIISTNSSVNDISGDLTPEEYFNLMEKIENKKDIFSESNKRLMKLAKDIKFV